MRRDETSAVNDVSVLVAQYRECARHVWNTYFRDLKGDRYGFVEGFDEVNAALFRDLVLEQIAGDSRGPSERQLRVIPKIPAQGYLPILWARRAPDGNWYWKQGQLRRGSGRLVFVEFFDFCGPRDVRDLRYVRVKAMNMDDPSDMEGADLLIESEHVQFVYEKPKKRRQR